MDDNIKYSRLRQGTFPSGSITKGFTSLWVLFETVTLGLLFG
jgi:hypothetical protein